MERTGIRFLRNVLVSALLFGLFAEWLRPLASMAAMTEIHQLYPFLGAIALYMIIDAFHLRGGWGWPLKLVFTIGWIGYWFQPEAFFSGSWWIEFVELIAEDARMTASGEWLVRPEERTFLFLAGWSALVYAVHRIVVDRGQVLWFVASTLCFLLLLQLWPGLDTHAGVLRTAAMGMLLVTMLHGSKWARQLGSRFAEGRSAAMARVGVGIVSGAILFASGYGLFGGETTKPEPVSLARWGDWVRSVSGHAFAEEAVSLAAATGYGSDDSRLGRPVEPNHAVAFTAITARPTYWRGDTKDVYTGQGWRSSALGETAETFRSVRMSNGEETLEQQITVAARGLEQTVFAGGPILRFFELEDVSGSRVSDIHVRFDADDDSYYVGTNTVRLGSYRMETALPVNDSSLLAADASVSERDPSERYLQLPAALPERVRDLARDIVADVPDHPYLQAAAIQTYLQANYAYTLETALPPAGADFVDTFLFETKAGYCNHFSSAMVVLLRAVGIEARWVKGFAPGTADPNEPNTYVVRQADAHSWVEVRFASAGWVPFEATPAAAAEGISAGFTGLTAEPANMQLPRGTVLSSQAAALAVPAADGAAAGTSGTENRPNAMLAAWVAEARERLQSLPAAVLASYESAKTRLPHEWVSLLLWGSGIALAALLMLYSALWLARLLRRHRPGAAAPIFYGPPRRASPQQRRLDRLWRRIYQRHGARPPAETMRDYAARLQLPSSEARAAMLALVRYDEAVRYGGGAKRVSSRWLDDVWRAIAK